MSNESTQAGLGGLSPEILHRVSRGESREKFQRGYLSKATRKFRNGKSQLWWLGRWRDYSEVTDSRQAPRRKRWIKPVSELSKSDAQRQLDDWIARSNNQERLPDRNETFSDLWKRYIKSKEHVWSAGAKRAVLPVFEHHVIPVLGDALVRELRPRHLQAVVAEMAKDLSHSTCHKYRTYAKRALDLALEEGVIATNPAAKLSIPQTKAPNERFLLIEEVRKLLAAAKGRDHLILQLLIECGFRPGELFALRWNDWRGPFLRIDETAYEGRTKQGAKTRKSLAHVPVSSSIQVQLEKWKSESKHTGERDLIFPSAHGTPLHAGNFLRRTLRTISKAAGVSGVNFQVLRRTCSTHILASGSIKDSQRLLRHSNASTTLQHYAKTIPKSLTVAVEVFSQEIIGEANIQ